MAAKTKETRIQRVSAEARRPDPWHWIEGLMADGTWMPLYCSQDWLQIRRLLQICLLIDPTPKELEPYEDFRLVPSVASQAAAA